jgi:hypothetical protein
MWDGVQLQINEVHEGCCISISRIIAQAAQAAGGYGYVGVFEAVPADVSLGKDETQNRRGVMISMRDVITVFMQPRVLYSVGSKLSLIWTNMTVNKYRHEVIILRNFDLRLYLVN